jgi:hypothetical protein
LARPTPAVVQETVRALRRENETVLAQQDADEEGGQQSVPVSGLEARSGSSPARASGLNVRLRKVVEWLTASFAKNPRGPKGK